MLPDKEVSVCKIKKTCSRSKRTRLPKRKKKTLSMTERFAAFARRRRAKRAAITVRTAVPR